MASISTSSLDTGKNIYIANGCGKLFFFEHVPDDVEEWFYENDIHLSVSNNFSSCEWGFLDEPKGHMVSITTSSIDEDDEYDDTLMWNYITPSGQDAVVMTGIGLRADDYLVVLGWDSEYVVSDEEICANSIGTLTQVVIPEDDRDDITGVFTARDMSK